MYEIKEETSPYERTVSQIELRSYAADMLREIGFLAAKVGDSEMSIILNDAVTRIADFKLGGTCGIEAH